jgi:signal transduction histidine kinase/ActR/RegA family two-component response regulator
VTPGAPRQTAEILSDARVPGVAGRLADNARRRLRHESGMGGVERGARGFGGWLNRIIEALNPWGALAKAEADARAAEQRLREALDALPTGVVFLDSELRYILWNKAYGEIYHRSADLFEVGRPLAETLRIGVERGDYPAAIGQEDAWLAERLSLLAHPTGERHEQQIRDGRWVLIEERRTADGGVIGLRVDITDLKSQAAALQEALTRAEAAGKAKAEFLANMSHELKTPLNGVIGLAEVLARSPLAPSQKQLLDEILASAGRLHTLLGDLLDFNALEAGRVDIARVAFAPSEVAQQALQSFREAAEAKGLALGLSVGEGADGRAIGDETHLAEILAHLLSNAVKFTPAGRVDLRVALEAGDVWRFEVADTGIGFDASQAQRLFAGFEMGDASATRQHGGAGLGLAICARLAGLMSARLEAAGAPGQGATFTLRAPMPPPPALGAADRALRVLVADDNPTNRKVVELILQAVGAEVVSVENGQEAADAAQAEAFDLILMDLMMPVMDGLTAIETIRRAETASGKPRRPIVVLSANSAAADIAASHQAGADGHLSKPIRPDVLLTALAEATGAKD